MCAKTAYNYWETFCVQAYANNFQSAFTHTHKHTSSVDLHPNDGAAPEVLISQLVCERESTRRGESLKDTELNTNTHTQAAEHTAPWQSSVNITFTVHVS